MIDWAHIAGFFWGERAQADWEALTQLAAGGDLKARCLVFRIDYGGHQRRAFGEHAAHRIDNLGRALAGAGMLAMVEKRAEERAYAIARQSLNWRRP